VRKVLLMLVSTLATVLLRATGAFAAERTMTAALPFAISGNVVKYGGLAGLFTVAYIFRRDETPILTETEIPPEDLPNAGGEDGANDLPTPPPTASLDDPAAINSALFSRMQQLATEREQEEASAASAADEPSDSSDSWGTGDTAVLEPPKPADDAPKSDLFDGPPPVDFPTGFPFNDPEVAPDTSPAASEEQIAMMKRMFGTM